MVETILMTARDKELRTAKVSLEALMVGWSGALLSSDATAIHRRVREASHAARRAMAAGATPHEALLTHIAPLLLTSADDTKKTTR